MSPRGQTERQRLLRQTSINNSVNHDQPPPAHQVHRNQLQKFFNFNLDTIIPPRQASPIRGLLSAPSGGFVFGPAGPNVGNNSKAGDQADERPSSKNKNETSELLERASEEERKIQASIARDFISGLDLGASIAATQNIDQRMVDLAKQLLSL